MLKGLIGVCVSLLLALSFLSWLYIKTLKDLETESYKNAVLEASLKTQNEVIKKLELDTINYKESKEKQVTEIKEKYQKVLSLSYKQIPNTCDLKEFQRLKAQEATLKRLLHERYN